MAILRGNLRRHSTHWLFGMLACVAGCLLLLTTTCQAVAVPPTESSTELPAAAAAASFSLDAIDTLTLVFQVVSNTTTQQPTAPSAYKGLPMGRWKFLGGDGYILVTRNNFGPLFGVLTEMMYLPGKFHPCAGSNDTFYSAQRFWVDWGISQDIGRTIWGMPKELATFEWGPRSVEAKGMAGNVFFSARLDSAVASGLHDGSSPSWLRQIEENGIQTLQWPLKNAKINIGKLVTVDITVRGSAESEGAAAPAAAAAAAQGEEAKAKAAVAAALLPNNMKRALQTPQNISSNPQISPMESAEVSRQNSAAESAASDAKFLLPNKQSLRFEDYEQFMVVKADDIKLDPYAFTGRKGQLLSLNMEQVGFFDGSPGKFDAPAFYKCPEKDQANR